MRVARVVVMLLTLTGGILIGAAFVAGHDVRLDEALAALQKAAALVEASSTGGATHQTQNTFDRHIDKALSDIEEAMDHIAAAAAASDADGGAQ